MVDLSQGTENGACLCASGASPVFLAGAESGWVQKKPPCRGQKMIRKEKFGPSASYFDFAHGRGERMNLVEFWGRST